MSSPHAILPRLEAGRPIILGGDPMATLRIGGAPLEGPASVGRLVREAPGAVLDYYVREIGAGVDVLAALTTETTPRSLGQIGMAFRAAALTGAAIDLAQEAAQQAPRAVAVAGVLGPTTVKEADRLAEEYATHAARLVAAGCEIILARGGSSEPSLARMARIAATASASATELSTWVTLAITRELLTSDGEDLEDAAGAAAEAGAHVILIDAGDAEIAMKALARARSSGLHLGVLLQASGEDGDEDAWAAQLRALVDAGSRVIGGGVGTGPRHVGALARALGRVEPSSIWPRAV